MGDTPTTNPSYDPNAGGSQAANDAAVRDRIASTSASYRPPVNDPSNPIAAIQNTVAALTGTQVLQQQRAAEAQQWTTLPDYLKQQAWSAYALAHGINPDPDFTHQPPADPAEMTRLLATIQPFTAYDPGHRLYTAYDWNTLQSELNQPGAIDTSGLANGTMGPGGTTNQQSDLGGLAMPDGPTYQANGGDVQSAVGLSQGRAEPWMNSVVFYAGKANVPWQILFGLVNATSGFDPSASQGHNIGMAGIDTSFGQVQTDQANDPNFALQWAANKLADLYSRYSDWGLALIAYHSGSATADYLRQTGHPAAGTAVESSKFLSKAIGAGSGLDRAGLDLSQPDISTTLAVLGKGAQSVVLPDQNTLAQKITTNFRATFFREPTPQEVSQFMGVANQAITESQLSTPNPYDQAGIGASSGQGAGGNVVATAAHYNGTPYGVGNGQVDCSLLVQDVFKQFGVDPGRDTGAQFNNRNGQTISDLSQALPGDLVFFGWDGQRPDHVGIYMGNGKMIDSPHTGTTVGVHDIAGYGAIAGIRRFAVPGTAGTAGSNVTFAKDGTGMPEVANAMQGTAAYQQLYSHKQVSQDPAQYAAQFQAAGKIGDVAASDQAVTAGMETGNTNITQQVAEEQAVASGNTAAVDDPWAATALMLSKLI